MKMSPDEIAKKEIEARIGLEIAFRKENGMMEVEDHQMSYIIEANRIDVITRTSSFSFNILEPVGGKDNEEELNPTSDVDVAKANAEGKKVEEKTVEMPVEKPAKLVTAPVAAKSSLAEDAEREGKEQAAKMAAARDTKKAVEQPKKK